MAGYQNQSLDNVLDTGSHLNPDQARTIAQLFQDVANGLPPAISTSMFQNSIQSVKDLARVLVDFFNHGLKNFKIDVSLVLARQFNFHRNYPLALINSITRLGRQNLDENEMLMFVDLTVRICQELGGARNLMTSSLVDILLQWTMPRMNKRLELQQAKVALDLVKKVSLSISMDSKYSFQFLYHQIRARLIGASKSDFQEDSNYGNFCFETKSVLLDILILLSRIKLPSFSSADSDYVLEGDLYVDVEANNNISDLVKEGAKHKIQADVNSSVNSHSEDVVSKKSDIETIRQGSKENSDPVENNGLTLPRPSAPSIKLFTPKMFEEETKTPACTLSHARQVNSSFEVTPYQDPIDKLFHNQRDDEDVLGYLNSPNGGYSIPVQNNSCIGKDPRCTIILDGKDVSLLHARVKQVDGGVKLETLSKTHRVKLNGGLVLYGRELAMKDKDVVEIGKEKFTWNLHPNNIATY